MNAPEQGTGASNPDNDRPAMDFESTALWPIDDPEQTSHIQRPPTTPLPPTSPAATEPPAPAPAPPASTTPPAPASAAADPGPSPHLDPEATSVVPRPTGNYTQPWAAAPPPPAPSSAPAPAPAPAGYAPTHDPGAGYHQQYGGHPQGGAYQPTPGYPPGPSGYPPSPGHPLPPSAAAESATNSYNFTPTTKTRPDRRRTALLIGAAVGLIATAAVCVTGFWKPGFFVTRQLNISKVQEGVQHILTDPTTGYGISGVSGVKCNNGNNPSGDEGTKFTCELSVNGTKHHVEATVTDDNGTYQVGKVT